MIGIVNSIIRNNFKTQFDKYIKALPSFSYSELSQKSNFNNIYRTLNSVGTPSLLLIPNSYKDSVLFNALPSTHIPFYNSSLAVSGNYISTPNATSNQIVGNIEVIVKLNLSDITATQTFIGKTAISNNIGYRFYISANKLIFEFSQNGTTSIITQSTVVIPFTINQDFWAKITRDSAIGAISFFTSIDGLTYTQLGTTITTTSGNMFNSATVLEIGSRGSGSSQLLNGGKVYYASISNSIGGTPTVIFNPSDYISGNTFTSNITGELWTITGTTGSIIYGSDFIFTRASSGTKINSLGLIETTAKNILKCSQDFNETFWAKFNTSITSNLVIAPNGTLTADRFDTVLAVGQTRLTPASIIFISSTIYTYSLYVKAGTFGGDIILRADSSGNTASLTFNLTTLTRTLSGINAISSSNEILPNGWNRVSFVFTATSGFNPDITTFNTGSTGNFFLWGAQIEQGSVATSYQVTTNNNLGNDIPRIDFSSGSASLLLEPVATNLLSNSNGYTDAIWVKTNTTLLSGQPSPSSIDEAFLVSPTTANTTPPSIGQVRTTVTNTIYTHTAYVKKGTIDSIGFNFMANSVATDWINAIYDLTNGIVTQTNVGTTGTLISTSIILLNNGWYRISLTGSVAATQTQSFLFLTKRKTGNTYGAYGVPNNSTFATSDNVFICYRQLELGSFATSYIPTPTSSTVTRTADVLNLTRNLPTYSTIYQKVFLNTVSLNNSTTYTILDIRTATNNRISLYRFNNTFNIDIVTSGGTGGGNILNIPTLLKNTVYKFAIILTSTTCKIFINGVVVYNNTVTIPILNNATVNIGNFTNGLQWNGNLGELAIYDTELTDSQCISLTT